MTNQSQKQDHVTSMYQGSTAIRDYFESTARHCPTFSWTELACQEVSALVTLIIQSLRHQARQSLMLFAFCAAAPPGPLVARLSYTLCPDPSRAS